MVGQSPYRWRGRHGGGGGGGTPRSEKRKQSNHGLPATPERPLKTAKIKSNVPAAPIRLRKTVVTRNIPWRSAFEPPLSRQNCGSQICTAVITTELNSRTPMPRIAKTDALGHRLNQNSARMKPTAYTMNSGSCVAKLIRNCKNMLTTKVSKIARK